MKLYFLFRVVTLSLLMTTTVYAIPAQYQVIDLGTEKIAASMSDNGLIAEVGADPRLPSPVPTIRNLDGTIESLNALQWGSNKKIKVTLSSNMEGEAALFNVLTTINNSGSVAGTF
ncbi:hypothetical protein [Candidatus Nitrosacidococcus sp. I8]|uniref:hypothetical protein n=1 Tax=Candidatus Nitrosacidococcus sp. I8 TaxID=2942908 RepID=UPI002227A23A|nr:hypothetical protein [Candidatus Nitrosacidococcus sp. I8]CAH9016951.1 hypothetical protein NURINAE_00267 [Candidatus Nitrosacidococcus sp. I8]